MSKSPNALPFLCLCPYNFLSEIGKWEIGKFVFTSSHGENSTDRLARALHVHVEAEITKGKYHDYDTFLGAEATQYLRLYIDARRKGSAKMPPETLTDESPLIGNEKKNTPKSIGSKQVRKTVHQLYLKADLIRKSTGRMYDLRVHSLRKYFKTQLLALGVQSDYVDYMMVTP